MDRAALKLKTEHTLNKFTFVRATPESGPVLKDKNYLQNTRGPYRRWDVYDDTDDTDTTTSSPEELETCAIPNTHHYRDNTSLHRKEMASTAELVGAKREGEYSFRVGNIIAGTCIDC